MMPDQSLRAKSSAIIGYVGVIGTQDGVDYLLRALHHLKHELGRPDFYAVLVGGGDALIDAHVCFTGPVYGDELMRLLSTADICVDPDPSNPYNDRSTMIKMTEYMALGKPIVAFDLPEHRVTAADAARYAAGNDERDFAANLDENLKALLDGLN